MKRRLFTILSTLSLLLCLASALLWVRSVWVVDVVSFRSSDSRIRLGLDSLRGGLSFGVLVSPESMPLPYPQWYFHSFDATPRQGTFTFLRFGVTVERDSAGITFPHWFLVGVFAILPVIWVRRWRRLRRAGRQGLCPTCGYDLRASKERCPECGRAIAPAAHSRLQ